MAANRPTFGKVGFAKTFILPAFLIFVVPILAGLFFLYAESRFSSDAIQTAIRSVQADQSLTPQQRQAIISDLNKVSFAELMKDDQFAAQFDAEYRFYFLTFRWMVRLAWMSIVAGAAIFLFVGLCVLCSLRSQVVQYRSLSIGWHVLRVYSAIQTAVIALMLVALSFWVTALWFNFYSIKLILIVGVIAAGAVFIVIKGIFTKPNFRFEVDGTVLQRQAAPAVWKELQSICDKVGANPPDQIIVSIDDRFFVTEQAVIVDGQEYRGKTLFVSLSLLRQLNAAEANAILAHEMAHFAGQDTLFSRKINPIMQRYDNYLHALHEGGVTIPVFYVMLCFRALYELSLGRLSRQREFRADRVAADTTSAADFSTGLLRVVAYSHFRHEVEKDLFQQERAMEYANVSERIASGFPRFAAAFVQNSNIGDMTSSHPFDSHPPVSQRLSALGRRLDDDSTRQMLASVGDGRWLGNIPNAEELERSQWRAFEQRFRDFHESTLPYRYLPETDEERAVVEKAFPRIDIEGKSATLTLDYDQVHLSTWAAPVRFAEITGCLLDGESGTLKILYDRDGEHRSFIELRTFSIGQNEALAVFQHYYGRYTSALAYRKEQAANSGGP